MKKDKTSNWKITHEETIFRIKLVFPTEERFDAYAWLKENKYWITDQGPYIDEEIFPKLDSSRMIVTAQRKFEG